MRPELNLLHLYPDVLNLYGDRGNILTLRRRCEWRDIGLTVHEVALGGHMPDVPIDIIFMGGDQDREQAVVVDDLRRYHAPMLNRALDDDVPVLAVCGSYQLLQRSYSPGDGPDLQGLGIFDAHTVHPGHDVPRCVGNIVVQLTEGNLVGFENHGGRTYLAGETGPLGRVIQGFGNNGEDGFEGARVANVFGSYVHGSLLPKNPQFADLLLHLALQCRYPDTELTALNDRLENDAHDAAIARIGTGRTHRARQ